MLDFFFKGGPYVWLILFFALLIVVLSIKKAIKLFSKQNMSEEQLDSGANAIIFWGSISLLIGFFAHFHGLYLAMADIAQASDISPAIVAEGYGVSLIGILTGMFIFLISAVIWFIFRWRVKKISFNMMFEATVEETQNK